MTDQNIVTSGFDTQTALQPHLRAVRACHARRWTWWLCVFILATAGCARIRPPRGVAPVERTMEVTGYCHCGSCTGWRRTWYGRAVYAYGPNKGSPKAVGITASGARVRVGTIAADTRLYPFGTIMYVPGYGYGRVEDRGGAIRGERLDLYFRSHREALEWGRRTERVKIWLPPASGQ